MSQRVSMIRRDQSSCSIIRMTRQRVVSPYDSASVSTIRWAINRLQRISTLSLLLTDTLSGSLVSSTSKVYINPSIVALRIQLVLSAFFPLYTVWPLSSCVKAPPMVGPTWMRVWLTLGLDCLPALFQGTALPLLPAPCLLHCLLAPVQCPMIQGCTSTSLPLLLIRICGPGGYTSWSHVHPLAW